MQEATAEPQPDIYSVFFQERNSHERTVVEGDQGLVAEVAERRNLRRTWPWTFALIGLLAVLLLQALVQFRAELALLLPDSKPVLQALCTLRGCDLALPHKAELLGIEASDLHPDAGPRGSLILQATLKNRAPFAQEYPALELTLTDLAELPLLRRVIAPKEYLPAGTDLALGFPASGERSITLTLETGESGAAGYRLYLFYP